MGLISGIFMVTIFGIALMAGWHHMMRYRSNKRIAKVSNEVLESGEETYFPALHVSLDNPSAVSIPVLTISFFSSLKYDVI
ncbi:hypothetical protein LOK49_LG11G01349 [Camellia lanceoleosa]|uniref:Uncharacterized protein n=1 Tax=Camellia lanceoleosa TaxID=1840588 RepID=A0ACC0G3T6_9ERIC|nr:hypothetical protein LOK49_LG11G01349 [Camellia lanceoleosa]